MGQQGFCCVGGCCLPRLYLADRMDHSATLFREKVSSMELLTDHTILVEYCAAAQGLAVREMLLQGPSGHSNTPIMLAGETGRTGLSTLFSGGLHANHSTTDPDQPGQGE